MLTTIANAAHRNSGDEIELIRKIKERDAEALEELYDLYSRLLYGIILSIVKKREEAEQLLQQTFMKIWDEAESFKEERDNVFSWLVVLARKKAIESTRSKENQKGKSVLHGLKNPAEIDYHDPMETTIFSDRAELVELALDKIPQEQSEILKIAYCRGLSLPEIAGHVGIPFETVNTQIREGMFAINRILSEYIITDG